MEVHLDWDEPPMGRDKPKQKRGRPQGRRASSPAEVADQTGRVLAEREPEWLERLTTDPASFAAVEREVHEQARRQADLYVAGLLAKAGESPEMTQHVDRVRAAAEVPLRPPGKKTSLGGPPSGGLGDHGHDALLLAPCAYRQEAGPRGEWALPGAGGLPDQ